MLSNLKPIDASQWGSKNPSTLSPTPVLRTAGVTTGITVVINGYESYAPSTLLFSVTAANNFRCSIEEDGQAISLIESSMGGSTTIHYSVECGQNLENTRWVFTLKVDNPASTTPIGTFVFSKAKIDEDVLL